MPAKGPKTVGKGPPGSPEALPPIKPLGPSPRHVGGPKTQFGERTDWGGRREGYSRLPERDKKRRVKDNPNYHLVNETRGKFGLMKDLPKSNVAQRFAQRIRQDMPKFQATDAPRYAQYIAAQFARELERATIDGIGEEMKRALKIVRSRAEKQMKWKVPETRGERYYLKRLQASVIQQVKTSAGKWERELIAGVRGKSAEEIWHVLTEKEYQAKNAAEGAARTLLAGVYNTYSEFLLSKKKGLLFKWRNPLDKRTSVICRKIVMRTRNGVSLDTLRKIVAEEADKSWYKERNPLLPHPLCRSTLVVANG